MFYIFIILNFINLNIFSIFNDAPYQGQITFQDPASPTMEGILYLHDYISIFLTFILVFVAWMIIRTLYIFKESSSKKVTPIVANVPLEFTWALTPVFILSLISGNSLSYLDSDEELLTPALDLKIIGKQWFWTYEFMAFKNKIAVESHMVDNNEITEGQCENLEVYDCLVVPIETNIKVSITSFSDEKYSWTIPSLGIKLDAIPGHYNEGNIYIQNEGRYYGQCYSTEHPMPIVLLAVTKEEYNIYLHLLNLRNR